jgi:hypothetical protein
MVVSGQLGITLVIVVQLVVVMVQGHMLPGGHKHFTGGVHVGTASLLLMITVVVVPVVKQVFKTEKYKLINQNE